jgi:hypothetical protein
MNTNQSKTRLHIAERKLRHAIRGLNEQLSYIDTVHKQCGEMYEPLSDFTGIMYVFPSKRHGSLYGWALSMPVYSIHGVTSNVVFLGFKGKAAKYEDIADAIESFTEIE